MNKNTIFFILLSSTYILSAINYENTLNNKFKILENRIINLEKNK